LTTLFNFTGLNGELPSAGVTLDGKGNIYGTTYEGGAGAIPPASGYGTIWKYSLQTGELTTLVSFTASGTTGQLPLGVGSHWTLTATYTARRPTVERSATESFGSIQPQAY
jgi:uncharacterized repeat protein (TIGR03803 family)